MLVSQEVWQSDFSLVFAFPNVYAVTLKLKPVYWSSKEFQDLFEIDFCKYCDTRHIDYLLVAERGDSGNLHYHGLIGYPYEQQKKRFQTWFNKYFGKIYYSAKTDAKAWESYIYKGCPAATPTPITEYLFDPKFEPFTEVRSVGK